MATLYGTKIKDTYDGLLKVSDSIGITSTKKLITDGLGNDSSVYISNEDFQISTFFYVDINSGIPSASKIGIGTSSPSYSLHVVGNTYIDTGWLSIHSGQRIYLDGTGAKTYITGSATAMSLYSAGAERIHINATGTGLGTSSPSQILHVVGSARVTGKYYDSGNSAGTSGQILSATGSGTDWVTLSEISGVDGTGTTNYIPLWTDSDTIGDSIMSSSGTNVTIAGDITVTGKQVLGSGGTANLYLGNEIAAGSSNKGARFHSSNNDFYLDFQGDATQTWYLRDYDGSGGTHTRFTFDFINANFTASGDLIAQADLDVGGVATFTGQVTIPETPTADTHAASKGYVDSEIEAIPSGLNFQGNWNASTNSPTLATGTGTVGHFYNVSVEGTTNLDGITDWKVGDWAVFVEAGGTDTWKKIDNTSVLSGVGSTNKLAFWSNDSTLTFDTDFYVDGDTIYTTNLEATLVAASSVRTPLVTTSSNTSLFLKPDGSGHVYLGDSGNGTNLYHYSGANNGVYTTYDFNGNYYRIATTATSGIWINDPLKVGGDVTISKSTPVLKFDNLAGGGLDPILTATGTNFTISTTSITPLTLALDTGNATFVGNISTRRWCK